MFCTWCVRISVQSFAVVRHSVSEDIGPRQNKQTLKYLVEFPCSTCEFGMIPLEQIGGFCDPAAKTPESCQKIQNYAFSV